MKSEPATAFIDTLELRLEVIDACKYLQQTNHFVGTWGNISVRLEEGMLVTPSAINYDLMTPDVFVVISWKEMVVIRGHRLPSSESKLHFNLLLKRPDFGAIVHTHSQYLTALACAHRSLPVCIEDMAQIIGGEIKCAPYVHGADHQGLADAACNYIGDSAAVLLGNHGPVVGGRSLAEAVVATEIAEKAAMCYIFASSLGGCKSIPDEDVKEERERFLYKYGKINDGVLSPAVPDE